MADLEKITKQVIDKEKASLNSQIEEERRAADEEIQEAKARAEDKKAKQKERIDQEVFNQYDIEQNSIAINKRNEKLKLKQELIDRVLTMTQEKLDQVDQEAFKSYTQGVLNQFSQDGKFSLVLGEKSKDLIDETWLSSLNLGNLDLSLSERTIANESGFILEDESIEYNFLFSELIKNSRNDLVRQINQELFQ